MSLPCIVNSSLYCASDDDVPFGRGELDANDLANSRR